MTAYVVRPVTAADAELLLAWRNDPDTLRWARDQRPVPWDDHVSWLRATVTDDERVYRLVLDDDTPVAAVRYDRAGDGSDEVEVSIVVASQTRGQGVGAMALRLGEQELRSTWPEVRTVVAVVHRDNAASRRLFERGGYAERSGHGQWITLAHALDRFVQPGGISTTTY